MKSTNEMNKVVRYITSAPSLQSAKHRYNSLKRIADTLHYGDTFIHEDVSDFIDYMALGSMAIDMRRNYGLNIIGMEKRRGTVIKDEKGCTIGKTSCNVYRMDYDPDRLARELRDVRDVICRMFD